MFVTYKYKLYQTKRLKYIHNKIDISGIIYNHCIALHKRYYRIYKKHLICFNCKGHLTKLKKFRLTLLEFWNTHYWGSQRPIPRIITPRGIRQEWVTKRNFWNILPKDWNQRSKGFQQAKFLHKQGSPTHTFLRFHSTPSRGKGWGFSHFGREEPL